MVWLPFVLSKKELESLFGKLAHACNVVRPGKTFLRTFLHSYGPLFVTRVRRLVHILSRTHPEDVRAPVGGTPAPLSYTLECTTSVRPDMVVYICWRLHGMGCRCYETWTRERFVTDASGQFGCGALWRSNWLQHR